MPKIIKDNAALEVVSNVPYNYKPWWPFGKMEVGDSFLMPDAALKLKCATAASWFGKRHNKKFSIRGRRCWRIE
jgi:hypothetical protein